MRINPRVVSSAAVIVLTCAVTAAAYFYKRRNTELNEVMVFCKLQFNAYHCFDKFISYVEAAKKSISVCMPGIQNPAIQARLVRLLKEKNITVRIIIDRSGYKDSTEFFLKELIDAGAEIKCNNNPQYNMQHKFCIIDDKVLMTGTLNWGNDLSLDHWNYVYITNKNQLVEPVKREFYQMWQEFSSNLEQLSSFEELNESDECSVEIGTVKPITDTSERSERVQQSTFRETVTTPELYII